MTGDFRQRVLAAVTWSVSGDLATQAIRAVFGIALARLLSPREFGLLAMLTIVTQFVAATSDAGFEDALVQKRELTESHRSSVFWVMLVLGVILALGLVGCAPWLAAFYGVPELRPLAYALAPLFFLGAADTVPRALLARRLDFRMPAALACVSALVAGGAAVTLAWLGFGAFALAAQLVVASALETWLLFRVCGWRPRRELRPAALSDLLGFSAYRPIARTLGYWARHLDQLLIGKLLGSEALGLYARAYDLARFPVTYVSRSIVGVMFPSLALIQDEPARVREIFLRTAGAVALVTFPTCVGLAVAAEPLVLGVLGEAWRATVAPLRILSLAALVQSVSTLAGSLYLSQGRADLHFRVTAIQRVATMAAIVVTVPFGVLGVAWAQLGAALVSAVPMLLFALRLVGLAPRALLRRVAPILAASALMAIVVLAVEGVSASARAPLAQLVVDAGIGVAVYWIALLVLRVEAYRDVLALARRVLGRTLTP